MKTNRVDLEKDDPELSNDTVVINNRIKEVQEIDTNNSVKNKNKLIKKYYKKKKKHILIPKMNNT